MKSRRSKRSRKKRRQSGGMYEYPFESVGGQFNVPVRVAGTVPDGMGSNIVGNVGDMMLTQAKIGGRRRRVSRKSRRISRKSRRVSRKSRRVSRKSRRVSRKSRRVSRKSRRVSRRYRGGECSGCGGKLNIQLGGDGYNAAGFEGAIGNRPEIVRYDWNYQVAPNRFDATNIVPSLTGGSRRRRNSKKQRRNTKRGGSLASDYVMSAVNRSF